MKKLFILLCFPLLLCSCDKLNGIKEDYYGTEETAEKFANFVSSNVGAANNMSDEEMEDVICELYQTGVRLFCVKKSRSEKLPNERVFELY